HAQRVSGPGGVLALLHVLRDAIGGTSAERGESECERHQTEPLLHGETLRGRARPPSARRTCPGASLLLTRAWPEVLGRPHPLIRAGGRGERAFGRVMKGL